MTSPSDNSRWTGRLDQNWNSTNSTHFSISYFDYNAATPHALSAMQAATLSTTTAYTANIDHNWVMNPTTILTIRGGIVRSRVFTGSTVNVDDGAWGLPANVVNLLGGTNNGRVPAITNMAGLTGLGGGSVDDIRDTNYTGAISIQKMHGKHTFKAGYEHRRYYSNEITGGNFEMSTDRSATSLSPSTAAVNGSMFAGYLLGVTTWGDGNQLTGPAALQTYHGAYFQDDIKLTSKLTINAGVRWDYEPPRLERYNREVFWDRNYTWNMQPNPGWSWDQVQQTIGMTLQQPIWMSQGIHGRAAMMGTPDYPQQTLEAKPTGALRTADLAWLTRLCRKRWFAPATV